MRVVRWATVFGTVSAALCNAACASRGSSQTSSQIDAGASASAPARVEAAARVRTALAAAPTFATRLARANADGASKLDPRLLHLDTRLARTSATPVHLARAERASTAIEVTALDLDDVATTPLDGARLAADVAPSTDLVFAELGGHFEELRVLHDESAPRTLRWRLELSGDLGAVRVRDRRVEVLDRRERLAFGTTPLEAIDADGRSVPLDVRATWVDRVAELRVVVATEGHRFPIVVDPLWSATGAPARTRDSGPLVSLGDGRAVWAGGTVGGADIADVEMFDVATNAFTTVASLPATRSGYIATRLAVGAARSPVVLLVGGKVGGAGVYSNSATYFDPSVGTWSAPSTTRATHFANPGSNVVAFGGDARALVIDSTSEWYDPGTNVWTTTANNAANLAYATPLELANGDVVLAGTATVGSGASYPTSSSNVVSRFSSTTLTFSPASSMPWALYYPTLVALPIGPAHPKGAALLLGGSVGAYGGGSLAPDTALYDVQGDVWLSAATVPDSSRIRGAVLGAQQRVYAFGQDWVQSIDYPGLGAWVRLTPNHNPADVAVQLDGNSLLFYTVSPPELFSLEPLGTSCAGGDECQSGFCVDGVCCQTGSCAAGKVCNAPTHPGTCDELLGQPCSSATDCDSGFCVDGVCCQSACSGQCQACDVFGYAGQCVAVIGAPHGGRAACANGGSVCTAQACDGSDVGACHLPGGATHCGASSCAAGVSLGLGVCDGAGSCNAVSAACAPLVCNPAGTACLATCAADTDCVTGYRCDTSSGTCVAKTTLGQSCTTATDCSSGLFCTDGVCCGVADCGSHWSCNAPGKTAGVCFGSLGGSCAHDADCASGTCADGVCCNRACDGPCESCATPSAAGTCTAVAGATVTGHASCGAGGTDPCAAPRCDGTDGSRCATFVGADVQCRAAGCADGTLTARATCDGKGACPAAVTTSCNGYACTSDGQGCMTTCTSNADCSSGYDCQHGSCGIAAKTCSQDLSASVAPDGTATACGGYVCRAGSCLVQCAATSDCASGYSCDTASSTCVPDKGPSSGGGCSTSRRSSGGGVAPFGLLATVLLAMRRRVVRRRLATVGLGIAAGCAATGCASKGGPALDPDAGVGAAVATPTATLARSADLTSLSALPVVGERVRARLPMPALGAAARAGQLSVRLGGDASGPVRLATDRPADGTVSLRSLDTTAVPPIVATDSRTFVGAAGGADLVHMLTPEGFEELRIYRVARGRAVARWSVELSPQLHASLLGDRLIVAERGGFERFATAPIVAVDARGTVRAPSLSYAAGTLTATIDLEGLSAPVVLDPLWTGAPATVDPLVGAAAIALPDGRILAVGGSGTPTATQIYDDVAGRWTAGPSLNIGRANALLALVTSASGTSVVVAGGTSGSTPVTSTESWLIGSAAASFTVRASAPVVPTQFAGNGPRAVAVAGTTAYSFDGTTWSGALAMPGAAGGGLGVLMALPDGRVFYCGGQVLPPASTNTCSVFSPATNSFAASPPMARAHENFAFTVTPTKLVAIGGTVTTFSFHVSSTLPTATINVYDIASGSWSSPGAGLFPRNGASWVASVAPSVFLLGGGPDFATVAADGAELLDVGAGSIVAAATPPTPLLGHAYALPTLGALVINVQNGAAEIYRPIAVGQPCTNPGDCATLACVDGVCCGSARCGVDQVCNSATMAGTCTKLAGAGCAADGECELGHCVDGVCCNSACSGQCQACDVPGARGTCSPVAGAPHGGRTACSAATASNACAGQLCDGSDVTACHYPAAGSVLCGTAACSAGLETHVATCDGAGSCTDAPRSCGLYACQTGGALCNDACSTDGDCATGAYCDTAAKVCRPLAGLGQKCVASDGCGAGEFCTEGVCCAVAACPTGQTCAAGVPGKAGLCTKDNGQACATNDECTSRSCVDGVCCNSLCNGQCEACDVTGSVGTCTAVTGTPHGARTACSAGGDACGAASCDGIVRGSCAGRPGTSTSCAAAACAGDAVVAASFCDGKGLCVAGGTSDCKGYRCDTASAACKTTCTTSADCASGFGCTAGACTPIVASCSGDATAVVARDGTTTPCAPYYCTSGVCGASCTSTGDCQPGFTCDASSGKCASITADTTATSSSGGGCAMGRRPRGDAAGGGVSLALLLAASMRAISRRRSAGAARPRST